MNWKSDKHKKASDEDEYWKNLRREWVKLKMNEKRNSMSTALNIYENEIENV